MFLCMWWFPVGADQEHLILSVLHSVGFPVPQLLLYCRNISIIGTEFYVMEFI